MRYLGLGGHCDIFDIDAHLQGVLALDPNEQDDLAWALNERMDELAAAAQLPYLDVSQPSPESLIEAISDLLGSSRDGPPPAGSSPFSPFGVHLMNERCPLAPNDLLTSAEVASLLAVGPKTVRRWAMAGKITSISTPGGHRRFLRSEIDALVVDSDVVPPPDQPPVSVRVTASPAVEPAGEPGRTEIGAIWSPGRRADRRGRDGCGAGGSWGLYSLVAELVAETAVLAARAAQADRTQGDLVAASDAVVLAARRTAAAVRRLYEARAQAAEEEAEAIADQALHTTSDLRDRADASTLAFTVSVSDLALDGEAAEVAAALQVATTAQPRRVAPEIDAQALATADPETVSSG